VPPFRRGTPCARCALPMESTRRAAAGTDQRRHVSRGLCGACYTTCSRAGELELYPRLQRTSEEVLTEYARYREEHPTATQTEVAEALKIPRSTLSMTLARAARAGDPRSDSRPGLVVPSPRSGDDGDGSSASASAGASLRTV